jgi:hypothetical protein
MQPDQAAVPRPLQAGLAGNHGLIRTAVYPPMISSAVWKASSASPGVS